MNRNEDANVHKDPGLYRGAIKHRHSLHQKSRCGSCDGKKNLLELFASDSLYIRIEEKFEHPKICINLLG